MNQKMFTFMAILVGLLLGPLVIDLNTQGAIAFIGNVNAAPGGVPGPPDDGGGGEPPQDFGDLIILHRDADGVPILTPGDP